MPRPRKSLDQLRLSGTLTRNPGRYAKRYEPVDDRPIGKPSDWLRPEAKAAWREMVPNLPWLRFCHRSIVGLTAHLAGMMSIGTLSVSGMTLLNQCLGKLGATPESFPKIGWSPDVEDDEPGAEFFR